MSPLIETIRASVIGDHEVMSYRRLSKDHEYLSGHGRKFVGGYSVRQAVGSLRYRPQAQSRASSAVPTG